MVSAQRAPLKRINFLRKGNENRLTSLKERIALHHIVAQCFPALWDREGVNSALDFFGTLLHNVPSFQFSFVPDESAVEFIEKKCAHE
jgi:hypothetical protein